MVYSHWLGSEPGLGQEQGPGLVPIFQFLKMCPVMNTSVLPCPCSGAV